MNPVEIIPRLYLSSEHASQSMEVLSINNITHIVNMAHECKNYFPKEITYYNGLLKDDQNEHVADIISEVAEFIHKIITEEKDKGVLVHCQAGISRSTTMILGYLIIYNKMTLKEAYIFVKQKKPNIGPNQGYMKQLSELDRKMNGTESFSMQEYYVDTFQQYGFTKEAAERALKKTDDNFDLALDLLLNSLEN